MRCPFPAQLKAPEMKFHILECPFPIPATKNPSWSCKWKGTGKKLSMDPAAHEEYQQRNLKSLFTLFLIILVFPEPCLPLMWELWRDWLGRTWKGLERPGKRGQFCPPGFPSASLPPASLPKLKMCSRQQEMTLGNINLSLI